MKKSLRILTVFIICLSILALSCARQPSYDRSAKVIRKYFKKYGKKYPDTAFGKSKVSEVEILSQEEIHKHLVAVEAFVTFEDGSVRKVSATVEKGPLGWRFISWENAG